jgi:hypothetical protein
MMSLLFPATAAEVLVAFRKKGLTHGKQVMKRLGEF